MTGRRGDFYTLFSAFRHAAVILVSLCERPGGLLCPHGGLEGGETVIFKGAYYYFGKGEEL